MFAAGSDPELVRTFEDNLCSFLARRVHPSELDDVLQDVFVRLLRTGDDPRDAQRIEAWLYRIARAAIVARFHARPRALLFARDPVDEERALDRADGGSAERELAGCIAQLVATLPSPYRETLTLTELVGMSEDDAAAKLGVPASAMKSRMERGRAELRQALEACCHLALDTRAHLIAQAPKPQGKPNAWRD